MAEDQIEESLAAKTVFEKVASVQKDDTLLKVIV